jgi:hypothetical protein
MVRSLTIVGIAIGALILTSPRLSLAQGYGRGRDPYPYGTTGPGISPYLNLLRPGRTPLENYFLQTQPQIRQREDNVRQTVANQRLRGDLQGLESRAVQGHFALPAIRPTGAAAQFQTHQGYFRTR